MCRIFGIYFYRIFREICIIIPKLAHVFVCCKVFCMGGTVALQHLNMKFTELQICILVLPNSCLNILSQILVTYLSKNKDKIRSKFQLKYFDSYTIL